MQIPLNPDDTFYIHLPRDDSPMLMRALDGGGFEDLWFLGVLPDPIEAAAHVHGLITFMNDTLSSAGRGIRARLVAAVDADGAELLDLRTFDGSGDDLRGTLAPTRDRLCYLAYRIEEYDDDLVD